MNKYKYFSPTSFYRFYKFINNMGGQNNLIKEKNGLNKRAPSQHFA